MDLHKGSIMSEISTSGSLGIDSNLSAHQNSSGGKHDYGTKAPGLLISLKPGGADIVPQSLNLNLNEPSFSQSSGLNQEAYRVNEESYEPRYSTSSNVVQSHERPPHLHGRASFDHFRSLEPSQALFQQVSVKQEVVEDLQPDSVNAYDRMSVLESNQVRYYANANGDLDDKDIDGGYGQGRGEWQGLQDHTKVLSSRHKHRESKDLGSAENHVERHRPLDSYPAPEGEYGNEKAAAASKGKGTDTKQSIIEERLSMERPNRTLFVRNLDYGINVEEVRQRFVVYGDIQNMFDRIDSRGMVFIKYYDIRAAEYAKKEADGIVMNDRALDVHYALQRDVTKSRDCKEDDHH
ncbi:hypothetical protein BGZ65_008646, partial [Modicella reniformis]